MIPRSLAQRTLRLASNRSTQTLTKGAQHQQRLQQPHKPNPLRITTPQQQQLRYATNSTSTPSSSPQNTPAGDAAVEEITELYATAYDEFEIASESTEANATYAEEDRSAAREELDRVLEAYKKVGEGDAATAEEVRRRVGQRIRELEQGVKAMEERAMEHD